MLGKITGGIIGFALGGPLGALVGAGIGHVVDANTSQSAKDELKERITQFLGNHQHKTNELRVVCPYCKKEVTIKSEGSWICPYCKETFTYHRRSSSRQEDQRSFETGSVFFTGLFSMLGKLAKVDGIVTRQEINVVQKFMDQSLELPQDQADYAKRIFNQARDSGESFENFADQYGAVFADKYEMLYTTLDLLIEVALADGALHPEEERLILYAKKTFGISDYDYKTMLGNHRGNATSGDKYYSILGCNRHDSDEVIKRKYRKLMRDYHPDLILSKGLPEEFIVFANRKTQEITEAYKIIMKERGG